MPLRKATVDGTFSTWNAARDAGSAHGSVPRNVSPSFHEERGGTRSTSTGDAASATFAPTTVQSTPWRRLLSTILLSIHASCWFGLLRDWRSRRRRRMISTCFPWRLLEGQRK